MRGAKKYHAWTLNSAVHSFKTRIIVKDWYSKCHAVAICFLSLIINRPNCALNDQISKNNTESAPYNTKQRGQTLLPDWDASPITHLLFWFSMAAYDMAVICPENSINYIIRSRWSTCVKSIIYDWIVAFFSMPETWENSQSLERVPNGSILDFPGFWSHLGLAVKYLGFYKASMTPWISEQDTVVSQPLPSGFISINGWLNVIVIQTSSVWNYWIIYMSKSTSLFVQAIRVTFW